MSLFISGLLTMGYAVAALFFARFWRQTGERLLGIFSLAFVIFACQRAALAFSVMAGEDAIWPYSLRLAGFGLILIAILEKNLRPTKSGG
jgi:hypothetical protein